MTDILVTRAAVRKLAASLSKIGTTALRHTDRLDIIADAFGWKTDAFMHALKANTTDRTKPAMRRSALGAGPALDQLGIRLLDTWKRAISSSSGLCLACGATGSGRTTTLEASARYLETAGRKVYSLSDLPPASQGRGNVVLLEYLRDRETAERGLDYAEKGFLVLAVSPLATVERTAEVLAHWDISETRLGVIRGAISQQLVRCICRQCQAAGCDACADKGYKGRTLASHVVRFHGPEDVHDYLVASDGVSHGFAGDLARKLTDGVFDVKEVERVFGGGMLRMLSDRYDLPKDVIADLKAASLSY
jgi:general secretion pathway protein E